MKKSILVFACLSLIKTINAQAPWTVGTLNTITGSSRIGTSNNYPMDFYTNSGLRMSLSTSGVLKLPSLSGTGPRFLQADEGGTIGSWTGSASNADKVLFGDNSWRVFPFTISGSNISANSTEAKIGIRVSSPQAELDVNGSAKISNDLTVGGAIFSTGNSKLEVILATTDNPIVFRRAPNTGGTGTPHFPTFKYKKPCNIFFADPLQYDMNGLPYMVAWSPPTTNIDYDLYQIYESNAQNSVVNLGILNGDGILSVEPIPYTGTNPILKLNPGCSSDVHVCEGGGFTKIYNDASIGATLRIGPGSYVSPGTQLDIFIGQNSTKAISIIDPALTTTNKNVFEMSKAGRAIFGAAVNAINGSMLTIGQAVKTVPALSILDNSSASTSLPIFHVYGNGFTELYANTTKAFSIKNVSNSNNETFSINNNGYTEIKVYSPSGMPAPYSAGARAFTIRDMSGNGGSGRDIFVVNSNGVAYAREVEISNVNNFPDYVFDKDYKLKDIKEVEEYVLEKNHLPGFEKGEHYEKNGINVNDLLLKQQEQLEKQMLYIIQLEKRIHSLEKHK